MILAGDVGGTKSNLALFKIENGALVLVEEAQFASGDYVDFIDVINAFGLVGNVPVEAVCFGIAGPIINGRCRTTNLPWEITVSQLQEHFKIQRVSLLNDLEATAYGMLFLPSSAFMQLGSTQNSTRGHCAVIAAGTGLGEATLFYDGKGYHPMSSEGGHCDFAPTTPQQDRLLAWLRERFPKHVSYERILSGPGIYTLYSFLKESGYANEPLAMRELPKEQDPSAMISYCALQQGDALCTETLRLFVEIYGAEAGNLALKSLSLGGLYIGGGIAPKIASMMKHPDFMRAFVGKGRFKSLLENMEVKVSLEPKTALLGAAHYAHQKG